MTAVNPHAGEVPSIILDVERTIAALDPPPKAAALVTMARLYAQAIAYAEGSQNSLKEMGPKLVTVLTALGAGKAEALDVPTPTAGTEPTELHAARLEPGSPEDELAAMRARHATRPA